MTRFLDINVSSSASADRVVDVAVFSLGLMTIGTGSTSFSNSDSEEAHKILQQMEEKVARRDAVSDLWMKSVLRACGLIAAQASSKPNDVTSDVQLVVV